MRKLHALFAPWEHPRTLPAPNPIIHGDNWVWGEGGAKRKRPTTNLHMYLRAARIPPPMHLRDSRTPPHENLRAARIPHPLPVHFAHTHLRETRIPRPLPARCAHTPRVPRRVGAIAELAGVCREPRAHAYARTRAQVMILS